MGKSRRAGQEEVIAAGSLEDRGDSNALVLPGRRKKGGRRGVEVATKAEARGGLRGMSKNKERKLRRIQEEKEKKARLAESLELLGKYKLREDVHCLLSSSGTIGQTRTMREKRLLEAKFLKVGLEIPEDLQQVKRQRKDRDSAGESGSHFSDSKPQLEAISMNELRVSEEIECVQNHSSYVNKEFETLPFNNVPSQVLSCGNHGNVTVQTENKDVVNKQSSLDHLEQVPRCSQGDDISLKLKILSEPVTLKKDAAFLNNQDKEVDNNVFPITTANKIASVENSFRPAVVVHVSRPKEVEEQRSSLPIIMMEQEIMEAITESSVVIICGETGCGKTTQVPQFLYEAGYGSSNSPTKKGIIGITQPRRVAVLATARRVAHELGLCLGKEVGFQVRHDKMLGEKCSIKFMTDGILLRELQSDFLLKKYSIIILDEAHERSLNTDILIGMLSRITRLRKKMYLEQQDKLISGVKIKPENIISQLKLVLMSATLRVEDFVTDRKLFQEPPPVIEVPTRQFPVTTHFSKRTDLIDYVGQAYKKVMQIHKRLPPGGILVFLTGQREIEYLCKKLRRTSEQLIANNVNGGGMLVTQDKNQNELSMESSDQRTNIFDTYEQDEDDPENEAYSSGSDSEAPVDSCSSDDDSKHTESFRSGNSMLEFIKEPETLASLKASFDALYGHGNHGTPPVNFKDIAPSLEKRENSSTLVGALHVLPLYARLPSSEQLRIFDNVKDGTRLVVVATNVAETSLTIPGIKYVVDTGREKVRNYNHANGIETYEIQWISKASAAQRAGRAGRTAPGHCYRLYSSAVFSNIFSEFACPQISKIPVEGVVLFMKYMGISKIVQFPFPTRPDSTAVLEAERCLTALEAIDGEGKLTTMGRVMAQFPMSPRHSRMLLTIFQFIGAQHEFSRANLVLGYALAAAAALSFPNPFSFQMEESHDAFNGHYVEDKSNVHKEGVKEQKKFKAAAKEAREKFRNQTSDALSISYALQLYELADKPSEFCKSNFLHHKTMDEMSKLRKQLLQLIFTYSKSLQEFAWNHGSARDVEDAWRILPNKQPLLINEEEILAQAICAGWVDRVAKRIRKTDYLSEADQKAKAVRYQSCSVKETVFLHRWSMVARTAPEYLIYTELRHTKRPYMHGATNVKPEWLVRYASSLCSFSAPLADPKPYYEPMTDEILCWVTPTFGPHLWELPLYRMSVANVDLRVSIFACALLEGKVLPCMKTAQQFMASLPSIIMRPEAFGQKRVGDLLSRLKRGPRIIDSRASLREAWKEDHLALYPEIRCWFQEKYRNKVDDFWQRMHAEVVLAHDELFPIMRRKAKKLGR